MAKQFTEDEYDSFRLFLEDAAGITLGANKHYLVNSRLSRLMRENDIDDLGSLLRAIKSGKPPGLKEKIIDAMTTNETSWFRDKTPFKQLREQMLPEILGRGRQTRPLRIWSAACSSGQEVYSISMVIEEYLAANPGAMPKDAEILGTDISPSMVREAKEACYDKMSVARGLDADLQRKYFVEKEGCWQVRESIRRRASFKEGNLMASFSSYGKFDIIYCRNVLIYFSAELKRDILERLARQLHPQGYLVLGSSESVTGYSDAFELVRTPGGVLYRLKSE
ncbi:MAG: CheR family methyltransferase [Pseudomonadota bacterium]